MIRRVACLTKPFLPVSLAFVVVLLNLIGLSRNTNVPDCWARDDECRYNLGPVWIRLEFGSSEEAQGRAPCAQH